MKNENQVCTIEQAKRLKDLGIAQESIWYWEKMREPVHEGCARERLQSHANVSHPISASTIEETYSAFTVAELGVMLTDERDEKQMTCVSSYNPHFGVWMCFVEQWDEELGKPVGIADMEGEGETEAEARAWALITHLENDLVTVEDVNDRLSE